MPPIRPFSGRFQQLRRASPKLFRFGTKTTGTVPALVFGKELPWLADGYFFQVSALAPPVSPLRRQRPAA
ncbi:MAG TPA: hypothetical protein VGE65_00030, partial [Sphingobium sp.]